MFLSRCHKRVLFSTLSISLVAYFTWLLQLKTAIEHSLFAQRTRTLYDLKLKLYAAGLNKDTGLHNNHHGPVLLLANKDKKNNNVLNTLFDYQDAQLKGFEQIQATDKNIESLINFLAKNKAFLIDIDILRQLAPIDSNFNQETFSLVHEQMLKKTRSRSMEFLSFGIFAENLVGLEDDTIGPDLSCQIEKATSLYQYEMATTSLYYLCKNFNLQLTVFFRRGTFMWIGSDSSTLNLYKWFGDVPRAVNNVSIRKLNGPYAQSFYIPMDLKKFLFDYNHSKFVECDRNLANYNTNLLGSKYKQDLKKNAMVLPVMAYIASTLEGFEKNYWLAGGTLLGWYRDCSIIPHTQDVDFAILADEYDTRLKKTFIGNKIVRLWGTLGLLNDSYEFRMFNDRFTFDIFLVYKTNQTHQWCGYQVNRSKFRRWLPNFVELCSAELLNSKFMVPCDPVKYLNAEYGNEKRWKTPKASNYTWSNVVYNSKWTDYEWPRVIKYYDRNGNLLKPKILKYLNQHSKYNITDIDDEII